MLAEVRSSCAAVAEEATLVRIRPDELRRYAGTFDADDRRDPIDRADPGTALDGDPAAVEARVVLVLALDTINFGSGYHPVVQKRPGCSGAVSMAAALRDWAATPITAERLRAVTVDDAHRIFGQDPDDGPRSELMGLFATALQDLGRLLQDRAGGSGTALVEDAGRSADRLVAILDELPCFRDRATFHGREVLFFKRAQLTAADLAREFHGQGPGRFDDLDQLTAFADNLVPHVLRVDGVLEYDSGLAAHIDAGRLLDAGSPAEVQIRAAGVHAVELLRAELAAAGHHVRSSRLDEVLWLRGGAPRYKAVPRHRARSPYY